MHSRMDSMIIAPLYFYPSLSTFSQIRSSQTLTTPRKVAADQNRRLCVDSIVENGQRHWRDERRTKRASRIRCGRELAVHRGQCADGDHEQGSGGVSVRIGHCSQETTVVDFTRLQEPSRSLTSQPPTSLYLPTIEEHANPIEASTTLRATRYKEMGLYARCRTYVRWSITTGRRSGRGLAFIGRISDEYVGKEGRCNISMKWLGIFGFI